MATRQNSAFSFSSPSDRSWVVAQFALCDGYALVHNPKHDGTILRYSSASMCPLVLSQNAGRGHQLVSRFFSTISRKGEFWEVLERALALLNLWLSFELPSSLGCTTHSVPHAADRRWKTTAKLHKSSTTTGRCDRPPSPVPTRPRQAEHVLDCDFRRFCGVREQLHSQALALFGAGRDAEAEKVMQVAPGRTRGDFWKVRFPTLRAYYCPRVLGNLWFSYRDIWYIGFRIFLQIPWWSRGTPLSFRLLSTQRPLKTHLDCDCGSLLLLSQCHFCSNPQIVPEI